MKIVIVGAGAAGLMFGAFLARAGNEIVFVEKQAEVVAAINREGIGFMELGAVDQDAVSFIPASAVHSAAAVAHCDLLLLAVKSYDGKSALQSVTHLITRDSPIINLQTGLGILEELEKIERRKNILGGSTYMAATALGPGRVRHGGLGKTYLGELDGALSPRGEKIRQLFTAAGLETELVPRIAAQIWSKAVLYAAINPVTALLQLKNGQLLAAMESISLCKKLIDEGIAVAAASGIDLEAADHYDRFFASCQRTEGNISTMLQDLLSGRKTEIDSLNGELARRGQALGVQVEAHLVMVELIRLREKWGGHWA